MMFGGNKFGILNSETTKKCNEMGWIEPTEIQQRVLINMTKLSDIVIRGEKESGKTSSFLLSIIEMLYIQQSPIKPNFALVLVPTNDKIESIEKLTKLLEPKLKCISLYGGNFMDSESSNLKKNKYHMIISSPQIINEYLQLDNILRLKYVQFFVLDDAESFLDSESMRHIEFINSQLPKTKNACIFTNKMNNDIYQLQFVFSRDKEPLNITISTNIFIKHKIDSKFVLVSQDLEKYSSLVCILKNLCIKSSTNGIIVYTDSKHRVMILHEFLKKYSINSVILHNGMKKFECASIHKSFDKVIDSKNQDLLNECKILITTDTDIQKYEFVNRNINYIINFNITKDPKYYVKRIERIKIQDSSKVIINILTILDLLLSFKIQKYLNIEFEKYDLNYDDYKDVEIEERAKQMIILIKRDYNYEAKEKKYKSRKRKHSKNEDEENVSDEILGMD